MILYARLAQRVAPAALPRSTVVRARTLFVADALNVKAINLKSRRARVAQIVFAGAARPVHPGRMPMCPALRVRTRYVQCVAVVNRMNFCKSRVPMSVTVCAKPVVNVGLKSSKVLVARSPLMRYVLAAQCARAASMKYLRVALQRIGYVLSAVFVVVISLRFRHVAVTQIQSVKL